MNNQERIAIVLGWSINDLHLMIHKSAFTWMRINMITDEQADMLSKCRSFWQWWTNEWYIRDGDYLWETSLRYLNEPLDGYELQIALDEYVKKHLVSRITIKPNHLVTAELKQRILEVKNSQNKKVS